MPSLLRKLRETELELVLAWLQPGDRILEIGAGAGWQASALVDRGFAVEAIDLPSNDYRGREAHFVREYDGRNLPYDNQLFDCVFSSNVLEHVTNPTALQQEIERVLKPSGRAIHILPTATWRAWTFAAHYPRLLERTVTKLSAQWRRPLCDLRGFGDLRSKLRSSGAILLSSTSRFWPPPHGERGGSLSEMVTFSRWSWRAFFRREGWSLIHDEPNRLFYSGHEIFGDRVGLKARRRLSRFCGSSCRVYVLEPLGHAEREASLARATPPRSRFG